MLSPTVNSGDLVSWSYESPLTWPSSSAISVNPNACLAWVTQVNDHWYGAITEWLPRGQAWQSKKIFYSDRGSDGSHDYKFHDPLRTFEPKPKQVFYLFVCGLYWSGVRNVQERSNLVPVEFK